GVATFSTTSLAVGTHSLTAEYVGDGTYNPSTSNAVSESINNPGTVTDVSSSLNPSTYGQNVTFSALVNTGGTAPTGSVTFENGGASIGSGSVSSVSTTNELRYSTNFGAWATNDAVTITPAATTAPDGTQTASQLTVGSNGGYYILDTFPCTPGVTTYSVWLEQSSTTENSLVMSVRFNNSTSNLFTAFPTVYFTPTWGRASVTYTAPAGTTNCTMGLEQYGGTSVYAWGAQVEQAAQAGPYIATNGSAASGSGGVATFTTSSLPAGSLNITAVYGGDANNLTSTSPTLWQQVNKATPSISASCSPNPVAYLSYYSCTADVSGSATGTVTWPAIFGGATTSLSGGATSTPTYQATATPAAYSGTVTYNGDSNYNSISTSVSITSVAGSQSIAFTPPPSPVTYGVAPIALSATATSGLPVTFSVLSGPGTVSGSTLTITGAGTVVVAANQSGNGYYLPAAQVTQSVVVSQTPTFTMVSSSLNPSTYGQGVTFSALVNTGGTTPTGSVTFQNGGASIGSGAISAVSATNLIPASIWGLSGGNWSVLDYPSTTHTVANATAPDGSNTALAVTVAGSDHTVVQQSPAQYLAPYSSVYGHTYTFSIWARTPNGCSSFGIGMENDTAWESTSLPSPVSAVWQRFSVTYTFTDPNDNNEVDSVVTVPAGCTVQLWGWQFEEASQPGPYIATNGASASGSGGVATFTTSSLPAGSNSITTVYGGDTNDAASTSPVLTQTVTAAAPTLSVATSGSPSISGASVTFTATISSGPTGTITFYDGGVSTGTGTISGATATLTTNSLAVGTHSITAGWAGNADYSAVTSSAISQVVNPASQTISFAPLASPVTYGVAPIALSATATSGLPVTFSVLSGPGTVSGSTLTITGAGTVVVAANQTGNAEYSAAPQVTQSVVVNKATPTISWAPPAAITYGTALSGTQLNATSGGVAGTFAYSPASGTVLGAGTQTLSVTFTPTDSTDYNPASGTTSLTVNKATGVFTISSSANPSVYGSAVSITVSGPAAATGAIALLDGANPIGTGTLSNGVATISVPLFLAGSHSLTASYPGDANFLPSTSAPYTQVVNTAAVVITIASTVNPSIYGETVTFTLTFKGVTGGAVPTGSAVVTDGVNNLGTLTLNSSRVATFTTSALVAGTHSITAAYQGDSNYH
ncbi:MAG: beta strand repeat-containing protein, partial [Acidobacteriaceae bacterium]